MSRLLGRCMLGFVMLFTLAGAAATVADAQVVVRVGPHHRYHHHHRYYRHHRRYYR